MLSRVRWLLLGSLIVAPAPAVAFQIETPITSSCHEDITREAAAAVGFPNFDQAPTATDDQRRAMNDLVFTLPHRDPWTLALLIGVRSNDLEDNAPTEIGSLIHVHDDPTKQDVHCIRREIDDGPEGDVGALTACRAFIMGELETGGLLAEDVDFTATEPVRSYFRFRGVYTIDLPRFAYRLGRASHAIEDSFAHAMRDPDTGNVRSVLNYIDAFGKGGAYDPDRDGYPHLGSVDDCRRKDAVQVARVDHARAAVAAVYAAILDKRPGRRARVEAAIVAATILIPGCTPENKYCNAPELDEPTDIRTFGCDASGGGSSLPALSLVLVALGFIVLRRRHAGALVLALALIPGARAAMAQPAPAPAPAPATTPPVDQTAPTDHTNIPPAEVVTPEPPKDKAPAKDLLAATQDRSSFKRWHFDARFGAAWDNPAAGLAAGVAVDYKVWSFGFLAEWNPWLSFDKVGSVRPGVANAYFTVAYRWYHSSKIALATRIEFGSSTMLFELLGVNKFTTGIFLGGSLTTVRFPVSKRMSLTFDPIHFVLPSPRPFGVPFFYKQYRVTAGIEVAF